MAWNGWFIIYFSYICGVNVALSGHNDRAFKRIITTEIWKIEVTLIRLQERPAYRVYGSARNGRVYIPTGRWTSVSYVLRHFQSNVPTLCLSR